MPNATRKKKKNKKKMRAMRRMSAFAAIVLLAAILLTGMAAGWFESGDNVKIDPSAIKDDGMLRVYLKSLNRPEALGLTLDGAYTVDENAGFRFARGSEVSVAADNGNLLLSCGGLTINMGSSLTLTRHEPEDGNHANGIYIHESEKDALFAGDLTLINENGAIDAILRVSVEDYLYGVVAYEMSNSFPLEALKAQAVAARTYAMRAKRTSGRDAYDLVDTTQDQVYKGFDPAYKRVIQAVDQTKGVVGIVNGSYADCFYTASNGGQVASPKQIWGGDGANYIVMKTDPYDLENPESIEKRAVIPFSPSTDTEIGRALAAAVSEELAAMGMSDEIQDIRLDRILSAKLTEPDVEGSLMFEAAEFTLSVSGKRLIFPEPATPEEAENAESTISTESTEIVYSDWLAAPAETPAPATEAEPYMLSDFEAIETPFTVRLKTYGELESMLNLSINATSVETFELKETKEGFELISRRFGHGTGMSQRGAQQMAGKHDMNYQEILNFYYPGMSLQKIDWNTPALSKIEALPDSVGAARPRPTPRPTPAPLPPLQGNEYYARVKLETSSSTLNVRGGPSTSTAIVGYLSNKDRLIVIEPAEDNWFRIKTAELSGFVKGDYIVKE